MSYPRSPSDQYQHDAPMVPSQGNLAPGSSPGYRPADEIVKSSDMGGAQIESRYGSYVDAAGNVVERQESVIDDKNQRRANIRYWATMTISYLLNNE